MLDLKYAGYPKGNTVDFRGQVKSNSCISVLLIHTVYCVLSVIIKHLWKHAICCALFI